METLLLRNGRIVDGTGRPAFAGHLLLRGDRIAAVVPAGALLPPATRVWDAGGDVFCPGFVDVHSHADWHLSAEDQGAVLAPLLAQGITTVVGGNCGFSPAPVRLEHRSLVNRAVAHLITGGPLAFSWESFGGFLEVAARVRPAVNVLPLVGHAVLSVWASGRRQGGLDAGERRAALDALRRAFAEGAGGLSLGLGYEPGMYASLDEIAAFCRCAAEAGKPVAVHPKALSWLSPTYPLTVPPPHNLRALREILAVARRTQTRLQLSHVLFAGRRTWSTAGRALALIHEARDSGVDVMLDAFPFPCGNTTIDAVLPFWFLSRLPGAYRQKIPLARLRLEMKMGFRLVGFRWRDFLLMDACVPGGEDLSGLRMDEIARRRGVDPFAAMLWLCEVSGGRALMLYHAYSGEEGNEAALEAVLADPLCLFETDVLFRPRGYENPAGRGAFPRILGTCVRDKGLFSLEEAVRRMTGASAARFGLADRGVLAAGKAADVVVLDPATIGYDPPEGTFAEARPRGVRRVFLNGVCVVEGGAGTGAPRAGRILS